MQHETFIDYCKKIPFAEEVFPFDHNLMTWQIKGKIFAIISTDPEGWYVLKCNPEWSAELKEEWMEIEPAWHCNKKYWIQLDLTGSLPDDLIRELIRHSYEEVVKKLPKKVQADLHGQGAFSEADNY